MTPHILLWHWNRKGGGPRYTWELARALAARDDVTVSLSYSRQSDYAEAMRALELPSHEVDTYNSARGYAAGLLRLPLLRRRFVRFLRAQKVDVVVSTMSHLWSPFVAPALKRTGAPYCLVAHDAEPHPGEASRLRRWTLARDIQQADALVALSHHVAGRLQELRPELPPERSAVIPHGSFSFGDRRSAPRALPRDRTIELLFFGRLLDYKGIDILAAAYRLLRRRYGTRVRLTIAGRGEESAYGPMLRNLPALHWENRWIGEDEIGDMLREADLLLLPYREASQSGALAAAEYAALPAVATPVGGLAEEIEAYGTGVVAEAVTGEAFAQAVMKLIESPALYAACSAAAAETAQGPKSWETIAGLYVGFAQQLLEPPREHPEDTGQPARE
jgi:glycosyltransferase involved in cell wall biosynthesis